MDAKLFYFIAGSLTSLLWTSLPTIGFSILLLGLFCCFYTTRPFIASTLLGIIWMASVGHWQGRMQLSLPQTRQAIQIVGTVTSIVLDAKNIRFNLAVRCFEQQCFNFSRNIRVSWQSPQWQVQQGQVVTLKVKLKPPHGLANQGGFHYQQWMFSSGFVASGYVKTDSNNQLLDNHISLRQSLLNQMLQLQLDNKQWLAALAFGYRGLLTQDDWHLVQKTGVAHLIAISGLHLALVASLSYFIIGWIAGCVVSRFSTLQHINLHNTAILLSLATTLLYSSLAGFALPTIRAWLMLLLLTGFFLSHKNISVQRLILLGFSGFVLFFPLSIYGLSFWLSFSAVFIISFIFWRWPNKHHGFCWKSVLEGSLKLQIGLSLLMLPLIGWQFTYISLVSPFVNLLAVPLVTFLLVPICLLAVILLPLFAVLSYQLFIAADRLIEVGLVCLNKAQQWQWAYFNLPAYPIWVWLLLFLFVVLLCLPHFWLNKKYVVLFLLPLLSFLPANKDTDWGIDVLDVGQGVAVLVSRNNQAIMYDVGATYPSGFNMADSVILPILQAKGIDKLDYVLISHLDNDHAGSLAQLSKGIKTGKILTNQQGCQLGLNFVWQGLNIRALWPDDPSWHSDNNGSCVIRISDQQHSLLLPGDIDKSIEQTLVHFNLAELDSDILLAPHHGSNTSSSTDFINAVSADFVVFSQGFMNRWQFPRPEVMARFQATESATKFYATSQVGQVSFRIQYNSSAKIKVKTFRQHFHPYWYANFPAN